MLELAGVPYVGAGVLGSAIGMDKAVQKALFAASGLPVVPYEVVREPEWDEDPEGVTARVAGLGYPVFVKPATLGSSVGITKAHDAGELVEGLAEAFRYARKAVVEKGLEGDPRDRVRGARQRRPGRLGRRRDRADRPRVLRLRGEVPRRARARSS